MIYSLRWTLESTALLRYPEKAEAVNIVLVSQTLSPWLLSPQLDTDDVTVENSMSKSFDQIIRIQLDPIWNQLV